MKRALKITAGLIGVLGFLAGLAPVFLLAYWIVAVGVLMNDIVAYTTSLSGQQPGLIGRTIVVGIPWAIVVCTLWAMWHVHLRPTMHAVRTPAEDEHR